jgi:hypothetical protein
MRARLRLPVHLLPLLRALFWVDAGPKAQWWYELLLAKGTDEQRGYLPGRAALIEAEVRAEYVDTVDGLLAERGQDGRGGREIVRVVALLFSFTVIVGGLAVGLTPHTVTAAPPVAAAAGPATAGPLVSAQTQCGSALRPVAGRPADCHAQLDSRRTLAIGLLAVGGLSAVAMPLAARRRWR